MVNPLHSPTPLRILGVDPGFDRTGLGVIDQQGGEAIWVHHRCLQTDAEQDFQKRLQILRDGVKQVIEEFKPEAAAVEQLFFQTNVRTAMKVGMARGVIFLTLADAGLPIIEMTPNQLKQGITGWGNAGKKEIQEMVKRLLHLDQIPKPDDAADALALAIVGATIFRSRRG